MIMGQLLPFWSISSSEYGTFPTRGLMCGSRDEDTQYVVGTQSDSHWDFTIFSFKGADGFFVVIVLCDPAWVGILLFISQTLLSFPPAGG